LPNINRINTKNKLPLTENPKKSRLGGTLLTISGLITAAVLLANCATGRVPITMATSVPTPPARSGYIAPTEQFKIATIQAEQATQEASKPLSTHLEKQQEANIQNLLGGGATVDIETGVFTPVRISQDGVDIWGITDSGLNIIGRLKPSDSNDLTGPLGSILINGTAFWWVPNSAVLSGLNLVTDTEQISSDLFFPIN